MKGVGFVSAYDGIPKLSTIDCNGRVHPGALTSVGGSGSLFGIDSSVEWLARVVFSSANILASPPLAFEISSPISFDLVVGIHAWKRTVASVVDDPARARVLASRISDR